MLKVDGDKVSLNLMPGDTTPCINIGSMLSISDVRKKDGPLTPNDPGFKQVPDKKCFTIPLS